MALAMALGAVGALGGCGDAPLPGAAPGGDITADTAPVDAALPDTTPAREEVGGEEPDAAPDATADASDPGPSDAELDTSEDTSLDTEGDTTAPAIPFDPAAVSVDEAVFDLSVQAGDATPHGAVLWTHATAGVGSGTGGVALRLVVFEDGAPGAPGAVVVDQPVTAEDGGFVHVELNAGLAPGTWYRYAFVASAGGAGGVGGTSARSVVGRFRTALAPDALEPITFGMMSGTKQSNRPYLTLSWAAEDDLDAFLLLGDTAYNDGATTLTAYRDMWRDSLTDVGYRDLLPSTGLIATWDDHEVENNWDPEEIDPAQLAAGTQAFFETIAFRRDPAHPERVWRVLHWGQTADFFVLDCRSERLPSTRSTDHAQYISPEQLAWLKDELLQSTATFKLILNSVPITDMPFVFVDNGDRWESYASQREELLHFIEDNGLQGVLWLSADYHLPAIARVSKDGLGADMWELISGPGANMTNPAYLVLKPYKDQFPYVDKGDNYFRVTVDPTVTPPTATVEVVDNDGAIMHATALTF